MGWSAGWYWEAHCDAIKGGLLEAMDKQGGWELLTRRKRVRQYSIDVGSAVGHVCKNLSRSCYLCVYGQTEIGKIESVAWVEEKHEFASRDNLAVAGRFEMRLAHPFIDHRLR